MKIEKLKHKVKCCFGTVALSPGTIFVFTTLTGLYYTLIDLWADDLSFISDHISAHKWAFAVLVVLTVCFAAIHWVYDFNEKNSLKTSIRVLNEFTGMISMIVAFKAKRFRDKAQSLKGAKFNHITLPGEQIKFIISEAIGFLQRSFSLEEDDVDITIIEKKGEGGWSYWLSHQNWKHRDPNSLFGEGSAASMALESGQCHYIPSKVVAAKESNYLSGERDQGVGDGSIFVAPVAAKCKGVDYEYIISIVTYKRRLSDPWDDLACENVKLFLREISRRIELELYLKTIKSS